LPENKNKTLAEMTNEEKAELTAAVWRELAAWLQKSSK
jgi:xanthosine triphosphate pyrophosphatase